MKKDLPTWISKELTKLKRTSTLLDGQILEINRDCIRILDKLWKPLILKRAEPVMGPRVISTRLSETTIDIQLSGVYQRIHSGTRKQYLAYTFSPYERRLDMLNDPAIWLQMNMVHGFLRSTLGTEAIILRIIGANGKKLIIEDVRKDNFPPMHTARVKASIKAMEAHAFFPIVPCPDRKCPKASICFPILNR